MRNYLLIIFVLFFGFSNAQISPPGCTLFSVIDESNDGFTEFDVNYYVEIYFRNLALINLNYDLAGYQLQLYTSEEDYNNNTNVIGVTYTNTTINQQFCYLKLTYSGSGIEYNQADLLYLFSCHILDAIPWNGDADNDSVLNWQEDLNSNRILNDNDTDGDEIFNFKDDDDDGDNVLTINEDYNANGNVLDDDINTNSTPDYLDNTVTGPLVITNINLPSFEIFPNPTRDFINFKTNLEYHFTLLDCNGRVIIEDKNRTNKMDLSILNSGVYFIKIQSNEIIITKKIIKV